MQLSTVLISTVFLLATGSKAWTDGTAKSRVYTIRSSE